MTTTIFDSLTTEQGEIEALFRRLLRARSIETARERFRGLSSRVVALLRNERLVVYPHLAAIPGLADEVAQARSKHAEIESVIAHLRLASIEPEAWFALAADLHIQYRELITIEECALFPVARLTLATDLALKLGRDLAGLDAHSAEVACVSITYELAS